MRKTAIQLKMALRGRNIRRVRYPRRPLEKQYDDTDDINHDIRKGLRRNNTFQ